MADENENVNVRKTLIAALKPLLPTRWRLEPNMPGFDRLDRVTVSLRIDKIERAPELSKMHRWYTCTLRVTDPSQNIDTLDDSLDDDIIGLLNAIDDIIPANGPVIAWTTAERGVVEDSTYFAFDITIRMLYQKKEAHRG